MKQIIDKLASKELSFGCRIEVTLTETYNRRGKVGLGTILQSFVGESQSWSGYDKTIDKITVLMDSGVVRPMIGIKKNQIEILGHPVYIGDVLERIQELDEPTDWITESALIGKWRPCGLSKSLQQIAENSGYEVVANCNHEEHHPKHQNFHQEKFDNCKIQRLKDPNARALEKFISNLIL